MADLPLACYSLSSPSPHGGELRCCQDNLPEWSKGVDPRPTSPSSVSSNPTAVILPLPNLAAAADSLAFLARPASAKQEAPWPNG